MKRKIYQDSSAKNIWRISSSSPNVASATSSLVQASVPHSSEHSPTFSLSMHFHWSIK